MSGAVLQSGAIVPGQPAVWVAPGVIGDSSSAPSAAGFANVQTYGADPTGVSPSDIAFAQAFAASNTVFVPPGLYTFQSTITKTLVAGESFALSGSGQGVSELRWTNGTAGLVINYAGNWFDQANALTVSDLSFTTTYAATTAALTVNGNFVSGRIVAPTTITDCTFSGASRVTTQWAVGLSFNAVAQTTVVGCSFFGQYAAYSAIGISYSGSATAIGTGHQITNCEAYWMQYAVKSNTYVQGIQAVACNFTDVSYGFYGAGVVGSAGAGFSDLQEMSITGSQIDAAVSCVYITGGVDCQITSNLLILRTPDGSSTPPTNVGVVTLDSCVRCKVSGNDIVGTTTNTGQTGVLFSNGQGATQFSYPNTVNDNILNSLQTGIQVAAGSVGTIIGQNNFSVGGSVATLVLDSGTSTVYLPVSVSTGSVTPRSLADRGADWFNVKDYGALGNGKQVVGNITVQAGTPTTLVVANGAFTQADVGKSIFVPVIGAASAAYAGTIAGVTNGTTITISPAASSFVTSSSQAITYGTDDSAAINATITAAKARGFVGGNTVANGGAYPVSVLFPDGMYVTLSTINATVFMGGTLAGQGGATIYGATNGAAVIDGMSCSKLTICQLNIIGDPAFVPTTHIQVGRTNASGQAFGISFFYDLSCSGAASICSMYNMGSETTIWLNCTFDSSSTSAYAIINDGINHFGLTSITPAYNSQPAGISQPANTPFTNTNQIFINCRFVAPNTTVGSEWTAAAITHYKFACYWYSPGKPSVTIYGRTNARCNDMIYEGTMEGPPSDLFYFDADVSTTTAHNSFLYRTGAMQATNSVVNAGANISNVNLVDWDMTLPNGATNGLIWGNPTVTQFLGDLLFSSTGVVFSYPAAFNGAVSIGQTRTLYNNSQPATITPNYAQTIGGTTGAVSAITYSGVSPGVWKIDSGGALGPTVGPQITINPPPVGGTQATAAVVSMGMTSTGQGTITSGGTGYSVNDILTMSGGVGTAPQVKVTSAPGGIVSAVTQQTVGALTTLPASPYTWTGGTGTGFTTTSASWKIPGSANLSVTAGGGGYQAAQAIFSVVSGTVLSSGTPSTTLTLNGNVTVSGGGIQQISTSGTQLSLGAAGTTNPIPVMTLGAQHDTAIVFISSASVTNGATQTAAANTDGMYLKNAGNIATQTILLPPFTGVAGQTFWVASLGGIGTTATFQTSAAGTITGAPTTIAAGGVHRFVADTNTWYPQG